MKILLIDDSKLMQTMLSDCFRSWGVKEVFVGGDLSQAVDIAVKFKPDVAIIDFILGQSTTGITVCQAIFALYQPKATAIISQGKLSDVDLARAQKMGIEVLLKPIAGKEADFRIDVEGWLSRLGLKL